MSSLLVFGMEIAFIVIALGLIFLCSLGEAALVATNRGRLRASLRMTHTAFASEIWHFMERRENLSSLLTGIMILILLTSALTTHLIEEVMPGWGEALGLGVVLVILTFCEVLPKSIGVARAEVLMIRWFRLWKFLVALFRPLNRVVHATAKATLRRLGVHPDRRPKLTSEEVTVLLKAGVEAKVIEPEEHLLAERILRLDEIVVRDIMVPSPDLMALPSDCSMDDVMETIIQTGHSRLPLYDGNLDNIVGVIYAYDILAYLANGERNLVPLAVARPPYFVPETKPVRELLQEMRTNQIQIAIVLDEHGTTAGLVTLEDIVEEIVGELRDEHDRESELVAQLDDRTFIVDARMDIRQFEELTGIELPDGEFSTVGGFVFTKMGRLPAPGEKVVMPETLFIVEEIQKRRITKVRVVLRHPSDRADAKEQGEKTSF